jgi:hypothetical protein
VTNFGITTPEDIAYRITVYKGFTQEIQKHCLSKQRVEKAIRRLETECKNLGNIPKGWFVEFKKELGLE